MLSAPLEIGLSLWFLYQILGWRCVLFIPVLDGVRDSFVTSSIVGLVVMIILFPAPASIAGYLESAERQKMKAVRRLW